MRCKAAVKVAIVESGVFGGRFARRPFRKQLSCGLHAHGAIAAGLLGFIQSAIRQAEHLGVGERPGVRHCRLSRTAIARDHRRAAPSRTCARADRAAVRDANSARGTIQTDLIRRDFTINAMARDPLTGEVFDPWGGRADLERGVIRCPTGSGT